MNERIKELHNLACRIDMEQHPDAIPDGERIQQKFAELIVRECGRVYIQNQQDGVMTLTQDLLQHFGVAESSAQAEQEAAEFIAAENKKVASRYGYFPKLHPSEWKD